jgi:hypothetical protein
MGMVIVLPDEEYVPFPSTHKRQAKAVAYLVLYQAETMLSQ